MYTHTHACTRAHTQSYSNMQLDHAVVATKFTESSGRSRLAASHRLLKGYLVNSDGDTVRELSSGKSDRVREGKREREREREREGGGRERGGEIPYSGKFSRVLIFVKSKIYM